MLRILIILRKFVTYIQSSPIIKLLKAKTFWGRRHHKSGGKIERQNTESNMVITFGDDMSLLKV